MKNIILFFLFLFLGGFILFLYKGIAKEEYAQQVKNCAILKSMIIAVSSYDSMYGILPECTDDILNDSRVKNLLENDMDAWNHKIFTKHDKNIFQIISLGKDDKAGGTGINEDWKIKITVSENGLVVEEEHIPQNFKGFFDFRLNNK